MKVIHLTSGGDVGGAKTHVLTLLQALNRTDTAELVCFTDGAFADDARALGIPTTVLRGEAGKTLGVLAARIRNGRYDLIHCHGARANMYGALLERRLGLPVVTTVHSDPRLDYMGKPLRDLLYGNINRLSLRRMQYLIGVSDCMSELLIRRGFDPQRVYTLYNGVDFTERGDLTPREAFLNALNVNHDAETVVFGVAARISPVKDLATLVKAFARAARRQPNIRLLIAGDGEQADEIRALARELCPAGTVCFVGWLEDTDSFYNALDVNLLTSLSETFPYALTEGARYRCATIASKVGGVPDLIDDEINGLIFPAQDVERLAECIERLAADRGLREQFGNRLYGKTKTKFSIEATVDKQKEIYGSILRRQRRNRTRDGVMICGAYGRRNAGDDGILEVIVRQLREIDPELPICVISKQPTETKTLFRVDALHTFDLPRTLRRMRKTELYLSGGGSLIQDATSSRSLQYYLFHISAAKRYGNRVMMYGCGVGPVTRENNRKRAGRVIERAVDLIALRDESAVRELRALGVTKPETHLTADPALLLPEPDPDDEAVYLHAQGYLPGKDYFMVALRPWQGIEEKLPLLKSAIERASGRYRAEAVLFALEPGRDLPLLERLREMLDCPCRVVEAPQRWEALAAVIRRMRGVVSMRLHPLVFAAGQGIPVSGIAYDPKVNGFLSELGSDVWCTIEALDEAALNRLFDHALTAERIDPEKRSELRARAARNAELARKLLNG